MLITALAAALVGLLAAGIGCFALVTSSRDAPGPTECDGDTCIPTLRAAPVVAALKSQGHECRIDGDGWVCDLDIGDVHYELEVGITSEDQIYEVRAEVTKPEDAQLSAQSLNYLVWAASLPFGDDKPTMSEIRSWVTGRAKDNKDSKAKISGYEYELDSSNPHTITFTFRGVRS
ncbi:hypothetical protein [Rugosimonospora africana]|uniref:Uncharacterized protein n=1 Tax=Rugosimonospora africana TaxID=556532 RepID=A0A8J3VV83_9ACTN|nr:hypothetical protein [Rugosimonospora africana]GIH19453.1 hypothetical protein Raf01_76250 [Rugosimonospora africana]